MFLLVIKLYQDSLEQASVYSILVSEVTSIKPMTINQLSEEIRGVGLSLDLDQLTNTKRDSSQRIMTVCTLILTSWWKLSYLSLTAL